MPPSRRHVVALSATLLSTGCLGAKSIGPGSDTEPDEDRCHSGVVVRTAGFDPADDLPYQLDRTGRSIVAAAATAEYAEHTTYGEAPLEADAFVAHDGAFYRTDYAVATVERVPAFSMDVRSDPDQEPPADAAVVAFDDLPAVDRTALGAALNPEGEDEELGRQFAVREFPAPYPDGGAASRLVGATTWVRWRDRPVRVEVAGESDATRERRTLRYTVERVAETDAEFRQFVADRYLVRLDDLPADQRAIVEAADDGYEECRPQSEALAALRSRLAEADSLPTPGRDSWYVAFDDRRFELGITEWES
ncbi:hypothetical protein [Salinilacihabitans rarus]|uniref:hypothetical protein n=1 Tax=Salinilacihabitans rarus TaxID=2961596 RepID=UPI0020C8DC2C|nr:hypothetical protein [Salinilacihabitans rarus]